MDCGSSSNLIISDIETSKESMQQTIQNKTETAHGIKDDGILNVTDGSNENSISQNRLWLDGLMNAFLILPMTAGNFLRVGSVRDGKYASYVFLTIAVAIVLAVLYTYMCSTRRDELKIKVIVVLLIILLIVDIAIYTIIICLRHRTTVDAKKRLSKIKIAFLLLFTIGCVCYNAIRISSLSKILFAGTSDTLKHVVGIIYNSSMIVFSSLQFFFIVFFSKKAVTAHCLTYFSATMFVVANASNFIYYSVKLYFEETSHHNYTRWCTNKSNTYSHHDTAKSFLDPMVVENSLFAILLIKELFSNEPDQMHVEDVNYSDGIGNNFVSSGYQEILLRVDDPPINEGQERTMTHNKQLSPVVMLLILLLSLVACLPLFIIKRQQLQYEKRETETLYIAQYSWYFILKLVIYFVLIRCMYLLHMNYKSVSTPDKSRQTSLHFTCYLILLSAFGSVLEFSLQFIASILTTGRKGYALSNAMNIITTYLQTVFLLQMKSYDKINNKSISKFLLFLSLVNLEMWAFDSFYEAQFAYINSYELGFFGCEIWLTIRHVLIPMILFYRFKCFLVFLEMSNILSSRNISLKKVQQPNENTYLIRESGTPT